MRLTYRLILFSVGCIFLFKLIWSLATTLPEAPPGSPPLTWPSHLADLKAQADLMRLYAREHFYHVLALFTTIYLAKQTLLIPGSALANLAGGIMYGPWAILYVSFLTAIGSAFCYGLSYWLFGEAFFERIMGKRMAPRPRWRMPTTRHVPPQLFQYLMFIRLFPFSPNWFLNLASPFAGVPIGPFAMTAFLGLMPYNTVCVQAAATLSEVESFAQILNGRVVAELCLVSGLALLPAVLGGRV
ncbi:hypothetical protein CXG81DRAFT_15954, partial [Caulochytrium protostelioides]